MMKAISRTQRGVSLIEMMVTITLGLLILAGTTTLFVRNSRTHDEIRRASGQIENGRYALQLLAFELRNAGYYAEFDPAPLATPATLPDPCTTTADLPGLRAALPLAVQGINNAAATPSCLSDLKSGTDIVVIRRASTCAVGDAGCDAAVTGLPYFQASSCSSPTELGATTPASFYALDTSAANLNRNKVNCTTLAPLHQFRVHIYFIANNDKPGDGIPTLKRAELGAGGFAIVPLAEGVEDLQIEYGVDNLASRTGMPASYSADPGTPNAWRNAVAARMHLLVRNDSASAGYSDGKTYAVGANTSYTPSGNAARYKRHVYETSVRINNIAGRNAP
jgi:type IV pilus assembly protein PilW